MKIKKSTVVNTEAPAQGEGAYLASRFREPAANAAPVKTGSTKGEKFGATAAIISFLALSAILAMLYLSWELIKNAW